MTDKRLSLLQLDTNFPRIPGDVGCPETFRAELEIVRIPSASVAKVVSADPAAIEIKPFEQAVSEISGDLCVTSCGFLSYWQTHLDQVCPVEFISSSLSELDLLAHEYSPDELLILTFDASKLGEAHLGDKYVAYQKLVLGLSPEMHLRQVIENDRLDLDEVLAQQEIIELLETDSRAKKAKAILLECTNLPPYKAAIKGRFHLPVFDILTAIERKAPGFVNSEFL